MSTGHPLRSEPGALVAERDAFVAFLSASGCLAFGDFTLKSGQRSPFFVDLGRITGGRQLQTLGAALAAVIARELPETQVLFGPAYKGIAIATATAMAGGQQGHDWAICYDRKEAKTHGEGGRYIGRLPRPGERVVVVDDVISSGGTKLDAAAALERELGVRPQAVVVALDRRQAGHRLPAGFPPVHAVVTIADLAGYLRRQGDERAALVERFGQGGA